jgi:hypothetical protein
MGGFARFAAINTSTGGDSDGGTLPTLWQLLALVLATVLVVAALTTVPPASAAVPYPRPFEPNSPDAPATAAQRSTNPNGNRRRVERLPMRALTMLGAHTTKAAVSPNVHA